MTYIKGNIVQMNLKEYDGLHQLLRDYKRDIRLYQKERDINFKKHIELRDYILSRIHLIKEITCFDCCIEELEEVLKRI